jgi:hypothetical protein
VQCKVQLVITLLTKERIPNKEKRKMLYIGGSMIGEAIALSAIWGPYLLIQGFWMLVQRKNVMKICDSVRKSPAAIHFFGWTSLLLGLFIIHQYSVWQPNVLLAVTLLGWAYLLRALVILFMPQLFLKSEANEKKWIVIGGLIRLVWGIVLSWVAVTLG